jgi:hypothetical protein
MLMAEGEPLDGLLPDQWALANPDKVLLNRDHENRQAQERKNKKRTARRTMSRRPSGDRGVTWTWTHFKTKTHERRLLKWSGLDRP